MQTGAITRSLNSVRYYLTRKQKIKTLFIFFLSLLSSVFDVVGIASLVPVMIVASEPEGISKNKYMQYVYTALSFESYKGFLYFLIGSVFVFFLLKNLFSTWVNYIQTKFTAELGLNIVKSQLNKYTNLPFIYFSELGSANLINGVLNIPLGYVMGIIRILIVFFSESIIISIIIFGIIIYQPMLFTLLGVILTPAVIITYRSMRLRSQSIGENVNKLRAESLVICGNLFSGFVELKLSDKEKNIQDNLIDNQKKMQDLDALAYLYTLLPVRVIEMVAIMGILIIFLYSVIFPSNNLITLVGLFAAASYRLMPSVNRLLTALVTLRQYQYTIDNLESYRETKFNNTPPDQQASLAFNKDIEFNHLSFSFPEADKPALSDINIKINKGDKIGFIGSSGSGKTTLMNVLLRFYHENSGYINVDGQPLTPNNIKAWHKIIGYVKQDTFLMEDSIRNNITLNDDNVDEQRLSYAIEQASLHTFINDLPEGVETYIGERGSKLSGGQRQRIGIARALYKQTQLLILDEATSALDNQTEREVNEAINRLSNTDMTILIIAHRITTLRECDRIYELKDGKLIAEHRYTDLVKSIV